MSSENQSAEPIIFLRGLSKKYPIYDRTGHKLLELLTLRKRRFHREFWALKDIDLEVSPGTTAAQVAEQLKLPPLHLIFVNGRAQKENFVLQDNDELAIMPPIGGG